MPSIIGRILPGPYYPRSFTILIIVAMGVLIVALASGLINAVHVLQGVADTQRQSPRNSLAITRDVRQVIESVSQFQRAAGAGLRMSVPPGLSNLVAIAEGYNHHLVLLDSGLVAPVVECSIAARDDSGTLALEVPTLRGKSYYLQHRDSLDSPQWMMRPPVPGDGSVRTLVDPDANAPQRFYRVWQKP